MANNTTAVSNQVTTTGVISGLEINMPQIREEIVRPYDEDYYRTYLMIKDLGYVEPVSGIEYSNFQKQKSVEVFKVETQAGGATTGDIVVSADSIDGNGKFFPRKNHIIQFRPTAGSAGVGVRAIIDNVSGTTLSLKTIDGQNIPATTAGDDNAIIVVQSTASTEGSGLPEPSLSKTLKFENNLQRLKEKIAATGDALTEETWIPVWNKGNDEFIGYYHDAFRDGDFRMLNWLYGMFWFGYGNTTVTETSSGNPYQTSRGMFQEIAQYGTQIPYQASSDISLFAQFSANFISEYIPKKVPIWTATGNLFQAFWEEELRQEFQGANQEFLMKTTAEDLYTTESFGINYNLRMVSKNEYTYMFDVQEGWSNSSTFGAHDAYSRKAVLTPLRESDNSRTGSTSGTIGFRYKEMGPYNREFVIGRFPGFGTELMNEQPINEIDVTTTGWLAHQGLEFLNSNAYVEVYDSTT